MALIDKQWNPISKDRVILGWLRAERDNSDAKSLWPTILNGISARSISELLDTPDTTSIQQNEDRLCLLWAIRNLFFAQIPPNTRWFEVQSLTDRELSELRVVNHPNWTASTDQNELSKVAIRMKLQLSREPDTWEPPILLGHEKHGPFTIIEGNHRLTAYAGSGLSGLDIKVFVGLTSLFSPLNLFDCSPTNGTV